MYRYLSSNYQEVRFLIWLPSFNHVTFLWHCQGRILMSNVMSLSFISSIQWNLKEFEWPVFEKTCRHLYCGKISDVRWMYDLYVMVELAEFLTILGYTYFSYMTILSTILFYNLKYEWLCILVLNINIVDDIWVVNLRERSTHSACFCVDIFYTFPRAG